jgi:hypothetical protein
MTHDRLIGRLNEIRIDMDDGWPAMEEAVDRLNLYRELLERAERRLRVDRNAGLICDIQRSIK